MIKKIFDFLSSGIFTLLFASTFSMAVYAAPRENVRDGKEPEPDANGEIVQKIIHRGIPTGGINPFLSLPKSLKNSSPPSGASTASSSPISYHGGPVMASVSNVVLIWYGNWNQTNKTDTPQGQQIIRNVIYGLANDNNTSNNYSGITTGMNSALGKFSDSKGSVSQISSTIVECTQANSSIYGGSKLTDGFVQSLAKAAANRSITCNAPGSPDANAIYLVLSSSDISESSGFLTRYCGWHTYSNMTVGSNLVPIKYGFVGNPSKSISSCSYQKTSSPNNNPGVDAMISVIAHELEETVTDPQLNAWYNAAGSENADICGWTFGAKQTLLSNGSYYNTTLPTPPGVTGYAGQYLIQRALAPSNSACYINGNPALQ